MYVSRCAKPDEKIQFYEALDQAIAQISVNGMKIILGDMNARIGPRLPGEEHILGEYVFGRPACRPVLLGNRDLLTEFCASQSFVVANTLKQLPAEQLVTYHEPGVPPGSPISEVNFSMLDLILVQGVEADKVSNVQSDRMATLASRHFPVTASVDMQIDQRLGAAGTSEQDWKALQRNAFRNSALEMDLPSSDSPLDTQWDNSKDAMHQIAAKVLPKASMDAKRPWVSELTLQLLEEKLVARREGNWTNEKALRTRVKAAVRRDKRAWLEKMIDTGGWDAVKKLRRKSSIQPGCLKNSSGETVSSEERADTMALHLETVQWRVRPSTLTTDSLPPLRPTLPVDLGPFSKMELTNAIRKLKAGRATKEEDLPAEFFKAVADDDECSVFKWVLAFCNQCWEQKMVPLEWSTSDVRMLHKKGDRAECSNYRPISLQTVAGKLLGAMLKERLIRGGVEETLDHSQFGFRTGRSTEDAIYIARRAIELANARRQ